MGRNALGELVAGDRHMEACCSAKHNTSDKALWPEEAIVNKNGVAISSRCPTWFCFRAFEKICHADLQRKAGQGVAANASYLLELKLDGMAAGGRHDFHPILPLAFKW